MIRQNQNCEKENDMQNGVSDRRTVLRIATVRCTKVLFYILILKMFFIKTSGILKDYNLYNVELPYNISYVIVKKQNFKRNL